MKGLLTRDLALCLVLCSNAAPERTIASQLSIPAGNSSVTGRVTERESGRPLSGVRVSLILMNTWTRPLTTSTDADGQYEFDGIGPGTYRVEPELEGYAAQSRSLVDPADGSVTLLSNQPLRRMDLVMSRGGSIHGHVTDQRGQPIAGATVAALTSVISGELELRRHANLSKTDDRGNFVLADLAEGNYVVTVTVTPPTKSKVVTASRILPAFYPGTTNADEATAVKVGVGEVIRGVNVIVPDTELLRIAGQVVRGSAASPLEGVLTTGASIRTLEVSEDGTFELAAIKPGRYTIWVRTNDRSEAGVLTLDVQGDRSDISLALNPTSTITGRLMTHDGGPFPPDYLQVAAVLASEGKPVDPLSRDRTDITAEGTFELAGLVGERTIDVIGLTNGWKIDRVLVERRPIRSLLLTPGADVRGLIIVLRRP